MSSPSANLGMTTKPPTHFWAGGFLYDTQRHAVLLHERDGNTKINPNSWAFFGGLNEGSESPAECFVRELEEEIGIAFTPNEILPLCDYLNEELNTYRHVFYIPRFIHLSELRLTEGAGFDWVPLSDLDTINLTEKTDRDLKYFLKKMWRRE